MYIPKIRTMVLGVLVLALANKCDVLPAHAATPAPSSAASSDLRQVDWRSTAVTEPGHGTVHLDDGTATYDTDRSDSAAEGLRTAVRGPLWGGSRNARPTHQ